MQIYDKTCRSYNVNQKKMPYFGGEKPQSGCKNICGNLSLADDDLGLRFAQAFIKLCTTHVIFIGEFKMQMGPLQILLIAAVVLILFGRGKVSSLMGEFGKGITAFKKGVKEGTAEIAEDTPDDVKAEKAKDVTPADKDKL